MPPPAVTDQDPDGLPKVENIRSSHPISRPNTLQLLSQFLMEEQERRTKLREEHNLNSTWKDLQSAYDTLTFPYKDADMGFDTLNGGGGGGTAGGGARGADRRGSGAGGPSTPSSGPGGLAQRLAMVAASGASSLMGTPLSDPSQSAHKKARKERKKKQKEEKKKAKRTAKSYIGPGNF